jgi:hypothetical protein
VKESAQPGATRTGNRHLPHNLANCRRGVLYRPSDLLVTDAGGVARRELAGLGLIYRRPKGMFRLVRGRQCMDVRGRRSVGRGVSGGCGNRIADLACGCVSRPGKKAQLPCPLAPKREGPDGLDCLARTGVRGSLRLKQRQHSLGAIGSPKSAKAAVFFAQRRPTGFARPAADAVGVVST